MCIRKLHNLIHLAASEYPSDGHESLWMEKVAGMIYLRWERNPPILQNQISFFVYLNSLDSDNREGTVKR